MSAAKAAVAGVGTLSGAMLPSGAGLWLILDGYTPNSFEGHPLRCGQTGWRGGEQSLKIDPEAAEPESRQETHRKHVPSSEADAESHNTFSSH